MSLRSFFNLDGGYFETSTSRWKVNVAVLEPIGNKDENFYQLEDFYGKMIPGNSNLEKFVKNVSAVINATPMVSQTTKYNVSETTRSWLNMDPDNRKQKVWNNIYWDNISGSTEQTPTREFATDTVFFIFVLLYAATSLIAIFGNITAIVIFAKGKRSKTDLRPFLINLAVADLIMAIFCIPFTFTNQLLDEWIFTKPMCPIVLLLQAVAVTASVSTNMAIGIDRFYAVVSPLKSRVTSSKYKIIISIIWLIAISLNCVQLVVGRATEKQTNITTTTQTTNGNDSLAISTPNHIRLQCSEIWANEYGRRTYSMFILFLTYITPLAILTFTYSIVGNLLWRRRLPGNDDAIRDQQQLKSKRKVSFTSKHR